MHCQGWPQITGDGWDISSRRSFKFRSTPSPIIAPMTTHCRAPEFESQIALYAAGAAILRKAVHGVAPRELSTRIAL